MSPIALLLALACVPQAKDPETARVTLDCENASIQEILALLTKKTGVPVEVDDAALKKLDLNESISFKVQDITLKGALQLLFQVRGLEVKLVDKKKYVVTLPK